MTVRGARTLEGPCLDDNTLVEIFEGTADASAIADVHTHCDGCPRCRALVAGYARAAAAPAADASSALTASDMRALGAAAELAVRIAPTLAPGSRLGRYVVCNCAGEGAMGIVYAAYDPELDRRVALKLLHPSRDARAPELQTARMLREARAHAKLTHSNVVAIYDVGTFEGRVFLALEFVDGCTLEEWLRASERSVDAIVGLFMDAGRGLASAHDAGLVHRDFKPENVLVPQNGQAKVTDFGLARAAAPARPPVAGAPAGQPDHRLTQTGTRLGTPAYMAPEQHAGHAADARSDQFSFCVALYEALYRCHPFLGTRHSQIATIRVGDVGAPPRGAPISPALRRVLLRGLAQKSDDRYPSMEALLSDLDGARQPARRRHRWAIAFAAFALPLFSWRVATRTPPVDAPVSHEAPRAPTSELASPAPRPFASAAITPSEMPGAPVSVVAPLRRYPAVAARHATADRAAASSAALGSSHVAPPVAEATPPDPLESYR